MNKQLISALLKTVKAHPEVLPYLSNKARYVLHARDGEYKTYDFFLANLQRLIRSVYVGLVGGEFIDIFASLIQGQITQAYEQAWIDDGNSLPAPQSLMDAAQAKILAQFDHVDQFFRDIIDARVDNTPIDPLLARAQLWANRYNEGYNDAQAKIALLMGGKLVWRLGATEEHCDTCSKLDGMVDYAVEWDRTGLRPQNATNNALTCGGWRCDCSLLPTDARRSYGGLAKLGY
jgi:hypothetical protein